jgi:type II secretory pathway pseudopilin PulG
VSELGVVYLVIALLVLFVVIGALIPAYLPSLVRYVNRTVLKENGGH